MEVLAAFRTIDQKFDRNLHIFRSLSVKTSLPSESKLMSKKEIEIMQRVEDIFQRFDRDHDENLSIEEIMPFFEKELDLP